MPLSENVPDFAKSITIVLNEGDPKRTAKFTITEAFLTETSAYFKTACKKAWKEGQTGVVRLLNVEVDIFKAYLYWLWKGIIPIEGAGTTGSKNTTAQGFATSFDDLVKLWVLGDRLLDTNIRNATMDKLVERIHESCKFRDVKGTAMVKPETINLICSETTANSALRRVALDYYNCSVFPDELRPHIDQLPLDFLKELTLVALLPPRQKDNPASAASAIYHEHDDQHPKRACLPCIGRK